MVTTLHPLTDDYPHADVGTIGDVAQTLHFELQQIGYSLLLDDVIDVLIAAATSYAAHAAFEVQTTATAPITLDRYLTHHCNGVGADAAIVSGALCRSTGASHGWYSQPQWYAVWPVCQ
jgi:hypothetical protein